MTPWALGLLRGWSYHFELRTHAFAIATGTAFFTATAVIAVWIGTLFGVHVWLKGTGLAREWIEGKEAEEASDK